MVHFVAYILPQFKSKQQEVFLLGFQEEKEGKMKSRDRLPELVGHRFPPASSLTAQ